MNYEESIAYIEKTLKFGSKLGLSRIKALLKELGDPHKALKNIHIAGTNGKGSVSKMIAKILENEGFKVGLFTSPHLEDFRERIVINEEMITKERLVEITAKIKSAIDSLMMNGLEQPTEFEIVTAMMFTYFKEEKVDYAVIEVGLGGDMDSTNVLYPLISVITHISYDHQNVLGFSLKEIAKAKAGIIKDAPTVIYPQEDEALKVIEDISKEKGVSLSKVTEYEAELLSFNRDSFKQEVLLTYKGKKEKFNLNLVGTHQLMNAQLALRAIEIISKIEKIDIEIETIIRALNEVKWIGRFEKVSNKPLIILDGAHNIDGIERLKDTINYCFNGEPYRLILGILADKSVNEMVKIIASDAKSIYCVTPASDRASQAKDLSEIVKQYNKNSKAYENYEDALNDAIDDSKEDEIIIISGSLYMIGDMRKIIKNER